MHDVIDWRGQTRFFVERAHEIGELPALALFWGENDRVIPIRQAEELRTVLANCPLERFRGGGHFLHWQQPQELARRLLAYFDAADVPRAQLTQRVPLASA